MLQQSDTVVAAPPRRAGAAAFREIAVVALFTLLAAGMTWPLVLNLRTAVSDTGDPYLVAWILEWNWYALTTPGVSLWDANMFHPARLTFALSENMTGVAVLFFPLYAAGLEPLLVYNIVLLASFVFSGWAAYVLGRMVTGSTGAGIVAGIFFAFVPFRFDHLAHLQHLWAGWLPLLFAALLFYAARPSWPRAALFAGAFVMNGLSNLHWFAFGSAAAGLALLLALVSLPHLRAPRRLLPLLAAFAAGVAVMAVFLQPYSEASELYGSLRSRANTEFYSATFSDWLVSPVRNQTWGELLNGPHAQPERALFPGLLAFLLTAVAILLPPWKRPPAAEGPIPQVPARRPTRIALRVLDWAIVLSFGLTLVGAGAATPLEAEAGDIRLFSLSTATGPMILLVVLAVIRLLIRFPAVWGGDQGATLTSFFARSRFPFPFWLAALLLVAGIVGSLGLNAFFHDFLYEASSVFRGIRVPARWAMIAYLGFSMMAAYATLALSRVRPGRRSGAAVAALLSLALLLELRAAPILWHVGTGRTPAVYRWLAGQQIPGSVFEYPFDFAHDYGYLLHSMRHRKRLANGISGAVPPSHSRLYDAAIGEPITEALVTQLEELGVALVIVHDDVVGAKADAVRHWVAGEIDRGRLLFLRRFAAGVRGDWVFAVTKNFPSASMLAARGRDPAGRTPEENLEILLSDSGWAYNEEPFSMLDGPQPWETVRGELRVSGWALAPRGVERVNVRLANGQVVVPAERTSRLDVSALMPWYPGAAESGFVVTIPKRPRRVKVHTDLQIEIIDAAGESYRLEPRPIIWYRR
jgi:hypothetical protein